jgi:hypothetical protein
MTCPNSLLRWLSGLYGQCRLLLDKKLIKVMYIKCQGKVFLPRHAGSVVTVLTLLDLPAREKFDKGKQGTPFRPSPDSVLDLSQK